MRVLVTGHHGYIGSVLAPYLAAAGTTSSGSTRSSTVAATSGPTRARRRVGSPTSGTSTPAELARLRRDRPSRGTLERPARRSRPEPDRGHQRRRDAAPRAGGARRRRAPVRLRLVVLDVRRIRHRRGARRAGAAATADAVRRVEGSSRGGAVRARRAGLRPGLDAQRDGVRRLAAPPARHRSQQPRRLGSHDRADPTAQRRDGLAAARPRARRREDRTRAARRSRGADPRRGVQRRHRRAELSHPRSRRGALGR